MRCGCGDNAVEIEMRGIMDLWSALVKRSHVMPLCAGPAARPGVDSKSTREHLSMTNAWLLVL